MELNQYLNLTRNSFYHLNYFDFIYKINILLILLNNHTQYYLRTRLLNKIHPLIRTKELLSKKKII